MIGLVLWLLIGLYVAAFILASKKIHAWKGRIAAWMLLLLPVAIYMWDYPVVYYRHQQACKAEGGLKILVQPEKTDRVQLDGAYQSFADAEGVYKGSKGGLRYIYAEDLLSRFSPRLKLVEAVNNSRAVRGARNDYSAYTIEPRPLDDPVQQNKTKIDTYIDTPLVNPTEGLYILSIMDESVWRGRKEQWQLTRNGKLYATWTSFSHRVRTIPLINGGTRWNCYDINSTGKIGFEDLIILLLN